MAPERTEPDGFLAVIEAKIAALKALADSYRAALSLGALGQPGDVEMASAGSVGSVASKSSGGPIELPQGALLGKSLPAAIQLLMSAARRKLSTNEIVAALKDGGIETTSQNFGNTVYTALVRLKATGTVLKFNDGWALAEFYPENLRNRLAERDAKPTRNKPKQRGKAKKTGAGATRPTESLSTARGDKSAAIIEMVKRSGANGVTIEDVFSTLQRNGPACDRKYVRGILSREYLAGRFTRADGRYSMKTRAITLSEDEAEERAS